MKHSLRNKKILGYVREIFIFKKVWPRSQFNQAIVKNMQKIFIKLKEVI